MWNYKARQTLYALAQRAIVTFKGSWKFSRASNLRTCCCRAISTITPPLPHLLPCLHPPQCSFSRCSSFVSKAPLLSPSCQNHQLGGVQSVLMLSQQLPKCNNYSFFFFSSNVRRQSGVGGGGGKEDAQWKRENIRPFGSANVHILKAWAESKCFFENIAVGVKRCSADICFLFLSLSFSLCVEALNISHL